jgi:hypothetical protein
MVAGRQRAYRITAKAGTADLLTLLLKPIDIVTHLLKRVISGVETDARP